jgi:hypothetical protein
MVLIIVKMLEKPGAIFCEVKEKATLSQQSGQRMSCRQ